MNVSDKSCDVGEYLDYEKLSVEKNQLINQLKNVLKKAEEVKLAKINSAEMKISINAVLAHCALCYFQ